MSGEEGSHPPSDDIGWKFGIPISGSRHKLKCKFCGREINGGITRLKQHLAAKKGQVAPCQSVSADVRTLMMKHLEGNLEKKMDKRKQREEVIEQIRASQRDQDNPYDLSDDDNSDDPDMAYARKESMRLHREEEDRERYRRDAGNRYETGSNSGVGESTRRGSTTTRIANMFRRSSTVRESSSKKSWIDSSLPEARLAEIDVDLHRSKAPKQQKISTRVIKGLRKKLGVAVSQFVLYTHLPTNVVNSPWLEPMLDVAREVGKGVKVPTPYEVSEVFLPREYEELRKWIESHKPNWEERGVTIMCDGWSGPTRKHIINFLIYSNRGTVFHKSVDATDVVSRTADYYFGLMDKVVDEIGEKYIVQIVTDNEPAIKAAGKKLMLKRPNLYWTGCAAHCLDLILKDIGEKTNVLTVLDDARRISRFIYNSSWVIDFMKRFTEGKELLRPGITRFATNFIMLESIVRYKNALQNMFNCDEWKSKRWAKEDCGKKVRKIVNDNGFWIKASEILKVQEPLVRVLRLVDGDEKPTMGFVYEAMDKAKMAIEKNCRYYKKYWKMIDKRWQFQLHHDLHAAGYFLNPQFQYGGKLSDHREVMEGVQKVIQRLEPNIDKQIQAINQIMMFRDKEHSFGTVLAQRAVTRTNPAEWWIHFGASAPELQEIAVKVLSQTTSSSNCERNWSTFSLIHTKTRNRLKYQKLNKLVYVAYNMRLKIRHATRLSQSEIEDSFNPINLDYIFEEDDPLSPWLQEREEPLLDDQDNSRWLDVSDDEVATSSSQAPRRWQSDSPSGDGSDTESGHGLSPPSGESSGDDGGGGGGGDTRQSPYHGELGMAGFADNVERGDISEPRRHSVSSAIGSSRRRPNPQSSNSEEYDDMENRFGMLGVGGYGYGYQGDNYHQWRQPQPYPYPYYPSSEYVSAPHYVGMGPLGCPQPPTTGYSYPPPPSYQYGVPPPHQESSSSTFGHCEERAESSGTGGSGPSNTIYDHCTFNYFGGYGAAQQNQSGDHADADYEEPARNSFWY